MKGRIFFCLPSSMIISIPKTMVESYIPICNSYDNTVFDAEYKVVNPRKYCSNFLFDGASVLRKKSLLNELICGFSNEKDVKNDELCGLISHSNEECLTANRQEHLKELKTKLKTGIPWIAFDEEVKNLIRSETFLFNMLNIRTGVEIKVKEENIRNYFNSQLKDFDSEKDNKIPELIDFIKNHPKIIIDVEAKDLDKSNCHCIVSLVASKSKSKLILADGILERRLFDELIMKTQVFSFNDKLSNFKLK